MHRAGSPLTTNSATGEVGLVVGNHELLGAFFIVMLLLGAVFALGYVVGQSTHSTPSASPHPAQPAAPAPAKASEDTSPQAPPAEEAPAAHRTSAADAPLAEPEPGSYWQVKALRRKDAAVLVRTLKDMGLPALMSPSPKKPTLMRVLVGPFSDTESMGRAKTRLEGAGLPPIRNNLK